MSAGQIGLNLLPTPKFHFLIYTGRSRIYTHLTSQTGSKEQMTYYTHEGWKTFQHCTPRSRYHHEDGGIAVTKMESLLLPWRGLTIKVIGWSVKGLSPLSRGGLLGNHMHGIHYLRTGVDSNQSLW